MIKLSNYIGKQVYTTDGVTLGYVKNVLVTKKLYPVTALCVIDDEEEEIFLPASSVRAVGDIVIAKKQLSQPKGIPFPVGSQAFTPYGEAFGIVCDLLLDEEPALLLSVNGSERTVPLSLTVIKKTVTVYENIEEMPKKRDMVRRKRKKDEHAPAQNIETVSEPLPMPTIERTPTVLSTTPVNRLDLLGRTVRKTVFHIDGTPLAVAGEKVTPELLTKARRHNRLLQLAVNTLTTIY